MEKKDGQRELKILIADESDEIFERISECAECIESQCTLVLKHVTASADLEPQICSWDPGVVLFQSHFAGGNLRDLVQQKVSQLVPVVVVGETESPELRASAMRHGAAAYFSSCEDQDEVESMLQMLVDVASPGITRH